jgi:hypothetical protein
MFGAVTFSDLDADLEPDPNNNFGPGYSQMFRILMDPAQKH